MMNYKTGPFSVGVVEIPDYKTPSFVIGGGLSGLLCGYLTGNPIIVDPENHRLGYTTHLGPRILHETQDTSWLLRRLGIYEPPNEFRIGIYTERDQVKGVEYVLTSEYRESYYRKTRGQGKVTTSCMSGGMNTIIGWDMKKIRLKETLTEEVMIMPAKVKKIKDGNLYLTSRSCQTDYTVYNRLESILSYKRVFSTIPLPELNDIAGLGIDHDFSTESTTFVTIKVDKHSFNGLNYLYVPQDHILFHRINVVDNNTLILEFKGRVKEHNTIESHFEGSSIKDVKFVDQAQILYNYSYPNEDLFVVGGMGIDMVGRYGEWKHSIKADNIIGRFRKYVK